jgi:hypothetical protein
MKRLSKCPALRVVLLALYVLASAGVGFAHRIPHAPADDVPTFTLPDGTPLIICSTKTGSDTDKSAPAGVNSPVCEACLLTTAPGLLPPGGLGIDVLPQPSAQTYFLAYETRINPRCAGATLGARGPPIG